jgi:hypothetical protein
MFRTVTDTDTDTVHGEVAPADLIPLSVLD